MKPNKFSVTTEVIVSFEDNLDNRYVLLFKNSDLDTWQLPTSYVGKDETAIESAQRSIKEKVDLSIDKELFHFLNIYDNPERHPINRTIAVAYFHFLEDISSIKKVINPPKKEGTWFNVNDLPNLALDHVIIIKEFLEQQYPIQYPSNN
jgi:ADP-ribose pyrophosphatase YjhB (NUDIX family)